MIYIITCFCVTFSFPLLRPLTLCCVHFLFCKKLDFMFWTFPMVSFPLKLEFISAVQKIYISFLQTVFFPLIIQKFFLFCTYIGTYYVKAKSVSLNALNHVKQCHPHCLTSILFIQKSLTELLPAFLMITLCFWPSWGIPDRLLHLKVFSAFVKWEEEGWMLNASVSTTLSQRVFILLLLWRYDLLSLLCNKVLKFIFLRMKEQWAYLLERKIQVALTRVFL